MTEDIFRETLQHKRQERLARYVRFWKVYEGDKIAGTAMGTELEVNYVARLVDLFLDMLVAGQGVFGIELRIPRELLDDEVAKKSAKEVGEFLNDAWDSVGREYFLRKFAQYGCVTGDAFAKVGWEDRLKRIRVVVIDPALIDVYWEPSDKQRLLYVEWLSTRVDKIGDELIRRKFKQVLTETRIETYLDGELSDAKDATGKNLFGEVPVVHVGNAVSGDKFYGRSDIVDIIELNIEIDEKLTKWGQEIELYDDPLFVTKGVRGKQVVKPAGGVLALPAEGSVEYVSRPVSGQCKDFYEALKEIMFDVSQVPEEMLSKIQLSSHATAAALQMAYYPLVLKLQRKRLAYSEGLKRLSHFILRLGKYKRKVKLPKWYKPELIRINWPSPFPRDEVSMLAFSMQKMSAGMSTIRRELKVLYPELSDAEIEQIATEGMEEMTEKQQAAVMGMYGGAESGFQESGESGQQEPGERAKTSPEGMEKKITKAEGVMGEGE